MAVRPTREMIDNLHLRCEVEVDGGVGEETAPLAYAAGADVFVAGSSVFGNCNEPAGGVWIAAEGR
jgi:ribulose-phosphate 3-epimerase